jgi:hypothetical protein
VNKQGTCIWFWERCCTLSQIDYGTGSTVRIVARLSLKTPAEDENIMKSLLLQNGVFKTLTDISK